MGMTYSAYRKCEGIIIRGLSFISNIFFIVLSLNKIHFELVLTHIYNFFNKKKKKKKWGGGCWGTAGYGQRSYFSAF